MMASADTAGDGAADCAARGIGSRRRRGRKGRSALIADSSERPAGDVLRLIEDCDAILEAYRVSADRGHPFPRNDDADKVHWIRSGDSDRLAAWFHVAQRAQRFHRYRKRKLLAGETGDEASAANLAAVFEATQRNQQLPPRRDD